MVAGLTCRDKGFIVWDLYEERTPIYLGWWAFRDLDERFRRGAFEELGLERWIRLLPGLPREVGSDVPSQYPADVRKKWAFLSEEYERLTRPPKKRGRRAGTEVSDKVGRKSKVADPAKAAKDACMMTYEDWGCLHRPDLHDLMPASKRALYQAWDRARYKGMRNL